MQGPGALTDKIIPPQFQYPTWKKKIFISGKDLYIYFY